MSLRVAPREITDYAERAARVGGCDPSDAVLLAASVTFAEVHGRGGISALVGDGAATGLAAAIRSLDVGALRVLDPEEADEVVHALSSAVPTELLGMAADGWRRDGVAIDLGVSEFVDRVNVRRVEPAERHESQSAQYRTALAEGVDVDADSWARLTATAAEFLAAESLLDALSD